MPSDLICAAAPVTSRSSLPSNWRPSIFERIWSSDYQTPGKVGSSQPKYDAYNKAIGNSEFMDDIRINGMLRAVLVFSDHPRAKVLKIDCSAAKRLEGVVRVFTAKDIPGERFIGVIHQDWPVMIAEGETTRYIGDVLAGVVAETEKIARRPPPPYSGL